MADYDLYYWPVPFRGQFIRAILAYAGKTWDEHDAGEIEKLMTAAPQNQPVPFMGPPVLIDNRAGLALSQMSAIATYLGETLGLIPDDAASRAMTAKIVNDANDVIDEITIDGGREMWTAETWDDFVPRLKRWMTFWEATGRRTGTITGPGCMPTGARRSACRVRPRAFRKPIVGKAGSVQSGPILRIDSSAPECDMPLKSPSRSLSDRRSCDGRQAKTTGCAASRRAGIGMIWSLNYRASMSRRP